MFPARTLVLFALLGVGGCIDVDPKGDFACVDDHHCSAGWSCRPTGEGGRRICVEGDAGPAPDANATDQDAGPDAPAETFLSGTWRAGTHIGYLYASFVHSGTVVTGDLGTGPDQLDNHFDDGEFVDGVLTFSYPVTLEGAPSTASYVLTYDEEDDEIRGDQSLDNRKEKGIKGLEFKRYEP